MHSMGRRSGAGRGRGFIIGPVSRSEIIPAYGDAAAGWRRNRVQGVIMLRSIAVAIAVLASTGAPAQEQQSSFKTLLGRGYDIKSVTFARGEATENRDAFVVTLQKDKSVAVCLFAAANWINLSNQTLEDSRRCDVR
jgi:hypothetical protein